MSSPVIIEKIMLLPAWFDWLLKDNEIISSGKNIGIAISSLSDETDTDRQ
jgi:hypothetical protein